MVADQGADFVDRRRRDDPLDGNRIQLRDVVDVQARIGRSRRGDD